MSDPGVSLEEREFRSWIVPAVLFPLVAVVPLVKFARAGSVGYAVGIGALGLLSFLVYASLLL